MSLSQAAPYFAVGYIAFLLLASGINKVIKENRRRRTRALLARLNSPYFRQITDGYYRVGNISGVGK